MRKTFLIILAAVLLIGGALFGLSFAQEGQKEWKLVWSDEFNYTGAPDPTKWGYDEGCTGWGNSEAQCYTNARLENARVENGNLIIEARRDGTGRRQYTSARLKTKNREQWLYGRFEVRAKLPSGRGIWPAIWMLPDKWNYGKNYWPDSGEIDILEYVGYAPGQISGSVHTFQHNFRNGNPETKKIDVPGVEQEFHIYAIDWYPKRIDFFIDGKKYFTVAQRKNNWRYWPFNKEFYLLMNVAVGGSWGGRRGIDNAIFPQKMEVDYVRVYQ